MLYGHAEGVRVRVEGKGEGHCLLSALPVCMLGDLVHGVVDASRIDEALLQLRVLDVERRSRHQVCTLRHRAPAHVDHVVEEGEA